MASATRAEEWMRSYVAESLSHADIARFVDYVAQSMGSDVPELSTDADVRRDLQLAVRSQFRNILAARQSDNAALWDAPVAAEAHSLARTIARRGLELRVLSHLYHAGHRAVWRFVADFVSNAAVPEDFKVELVVMMWKQTSEIMNSMLEELAATYTCERERLLSGTFSMRVNTVREILDGTSNDAEVASVQLSYPVHRVNTALVLWTTDHAISIDSRIFEPLASRLARSASATEILCIPSGARGLWVWMVAGHDEEPTIDSALVPPGVRVAVGRPGQGIDGFRRAHREALAAQEIAMRAQQRIPVTSYRDIELVSMLVSRPDAMNTLIERELPGLLVDDELSARLRKTLRAVLSCPGNLEAAASQLAVHKNTVRYRIQQIEERIGQRITSRSLHLKLALDCFDTFGANTITYVPSEQKNPGTLAK
ncbi:helix-turn-helix domain-containing protein [Rhodococcus sp. H36-A4]|uniref:PucR family transcriptional regulator n=1 Tax=Rhodococcus sp. H36-A4 TaxID=3004353 RepID=UPI0022AFCB6B|nr:helix-turn-helix domain-containing protein [Rhodococcus sp. H36-A4]MCZ4078239.1 helix-turn-helix domain-containing protein [Rhodococcus sp. H36-A4]